MVANKLRTALSLSKRGIRANRGYLCDMRRVRILKPLGLTSMFEKDTSVTLLGTLRARMVFTNLSGTFSSVPALKSTPKFESIEV